jgi:YidC/Oxa1 family membrane protein insertase
LFALYRVIYNVPAYITSIKNTFDGVVTNIMNTNGYQDTMNSFLETVSNKNSVFRGITLNFTDSSTTYDSIVDVLYKCTSENWQLLKETFSGFGDQIAATQASVEHFNNFLGISVVYSPKTIIGTSFREGTYLLILLAILVPLLSAVTQLLNIRLMPQTSSNGGQQEAMANQMKTMNYMMPIYSFIMVFFLPVGVGIYWIAGALIRCIQQFIINKHFDRMDLEAVIKENQAKAEAKMKKKIEKAGVAGKEISDAAKINTRNIDSQKQNKSMASKASSVSKKDVNVNKGKKYKEGSLASKANLVSEFNDKNTK